MRVPPTSSCFLGVRIDWGAPNLYDGLASTRREGDVRGEYRFSRYTHSFEEDRAKLERTVKVLSPKCSQVEWYGNQ